MRIVFMGTPDFAACSLKKLIDEGFSVVGAFCQPDRPKGRGHKLAFCEAKQAALDEAVAEGHTELWDLADYFGVDEAFLKKAVCLYVHGNLATELYF